MTSAIQTRLDALTAFLSAHPAVQYVTLYGSFAENRADEYSDLDLSVDVSGTDNGMFLLALPEILAQEYPVLYTDFAPSLAPDKYILTAALFPEEPFLLADFSVTADPHCTTVTKAMLAERNALCSHTLKLFCANLKHSLRGMDCGRDIRKMYSRLPGLPETDSLTGMLQNTHRWLSANVSPSLQAYTERFSPYLHRLP